jgi:hypothetical protein
MAEAQAPRVMLSRGEMEAVLKEGGSVLLPGGNLIVRLVDLPPEAELARLARDPVREAQAVSSLQAQMASIQEQLRRISPAPAAPPTPVSEGTPVSTVDSPSDTSAHEDPPAAGHGYGRRR